MVRKRTFIDPHPTDRRLWVARALDAAKNGWSLQSIDNVPDAIATVDVRDVLSALRSCATDGVISIVGDETIAQRAISEAWPTPKSERRVSVPGP